MTTLDYLNRLTDNGTKVCFDKSDLYEHTYDSKDDAGGGLKIVKYQSESLGEVKEQQKILERVTETALNSLSARHFRNYVVRIVPNDFKTDNGTDEEWQTLLESLTLSIANLLTRQLLNERYTKSANTLLNVLQTRLDMWSKNRPSVEVQSNNGGVTINIQ